MFSSMDVEQKWFGKDSAGSRMKMSNRVKELYVMEAACLITYSSLNHGEIKIFRSDNPIPIILIRHIIF